MSKKKRNTSPPPRDPHSNKDLGPGCGSWPYEKVLDKLTSKWKGKKIGFANCRIPSPLSDLKVRISENLKIDMIKNKQWPIKVGVDLGQTDGIWISFEGGGRQIGKEEIEKMEAEEQNRIEAEKIAENEGRIDQLKAKLCLWEEEKGLPSSLWTDVSPNQLDKMKIPKSVRNVYQVYILEFEYVGGYYVGMTSVGYPWRCFQHGTNFGPSPKYNQLKHRDDDYKKGIVTRIMDLVNPIDKKFECSHWIEWWLQKQMEDLGFDIPAGKEDTPFNRLMGGTCEICKKICTTIRDEFNDNVFDEFLD